MRRERPDCPLQSTILVHDAYMALDRQRNLQGSDRSTLLAASARIMRRLLVDCARGRRRQKRGGEKVINFLPPDAADDATPIDALELHEAIEALKAHSAVSADIVELKFFGGMSHAEIAQVTGLCERTIGEKWRFARAWLFRSMSAPHKEN
jgi:RNA polymerase sigma-70 factor, ECF subfamily